MKYVNAYVNIADEEDVVHGESDEEGDGSGGPRPPSSGGSSGSSGKNPLSRKCECVFILAWSH